eukprot:COSAG02_NODE_116_length_35392_cov_302.150001_11_plen_103_part_00
MYSNTKNTSVPASAKVRFTSNWQSKRPVLPVDSQLTQSVRSSRQKICACGMAIFRPIVFYGVRIAPVAKQLHDAPLIAPPIVDWYAGVKDGEVWRRFTYASH